MSLAIAGNNFTYGQYQPGMQHGAGIGQFLKKAGKVVSKTTSGIQNIAEDLGKSKIISKTLKTVAPIAGIVSPRIGDAIQNVGDKVASVGGRKKMKGGAKRK